MRTFQRARPPLHPRWRQVLAPDPGERLALHGAASHASYAWLPGSLVTLSGNGRVLLLAGLQAELRGLGIACVLARHHGLVLRYSEPACALSGLTNPQLHIFVPGGIEIVTTSGDVYQFGSRPCPALDPCTAAATITQACLRASITSGQGE